MHFHGYELSPVISNEEIQKRVAEIAKNLSEKFKDEVPILIGILNGSFIFMSDLIRALDIDCEMDFIKLSSYSGDQSIGTVRLLKDISADITGRHVVIVEDIIDSGLTIKFIKDRMEEAGPESLTIITLLLKPDVANLDFPIDIVGFEIAPEFVVGYGLDYDQKMRHLSAIYRIEKE
ncbi:MAG TPA: hypoxanthine phosphoribosyltransferase [Candidatus Marinimicrobia bacterium]|jgi:hypoxanthine phosphoribosyltransferase|nr:hypoxanthine phosphoribosyltransferase [Candidatus Neomarinimicrobiota bacterium]MDP6229775.1 hypoxanthine phosphoribosyltransferase [Candidatus Neomarinimicrobiota bacterium]MDP7095438.1 hypoxanthine phosphoribosyltransferase [Candidatus Neomarinimicrobiota bacterium]MDP7165353.1 hypoxanthine phosphoribosyltransferase [Candidatus Neomarinimicrobiota bacterium]MDP7513032.1 hypoxanthine phosphoribosyltransferase [Candidatus Neomarinimicrobiota bacterium]|tara:strand:+ start:255 stop:785 length:531 start_codon:yes stop_codon:yes gene_type:complete